MTFLESGDGRERSVFKVMLRDLDSLGSLDDLEEFRFYGQFETGESKSFDPGGSEFLEAVEKLARAISNRLRALSQGMA
jgi:hypothetical protein